MIGGAELARTIPGPEDVVHPRAARRALYPPGWNLNQPPPKAVRGRGPYGTPARQVVCVDDGLATAQAPHRGFSAGPRVHTCGVATEGTPSLRGQAPGVRSSCLDRQRGHGHRFPIPGGHALGMWLLARIKNRGPAMASRAVETGRPTVRRWWQSMRLDLVQAGEGRRPRGIRRNSPTSEVDRLHAIARLVLRDPDLAEDAVQEALVRCWRQLPQVARRSALRRLVVQDPHARPRRTNTGAGGGTRRRSRPSAWNPPMADAASGLADRDRARGRLPTPLARPSRGRRAPPLRGSCRFLR